MNQKINDNPRSGYLWPEGPQKDSYGEPWSDRSYNIPLANPTFNWLHEDATMEVLLRGWHMHSLLRDRSITYTDLALELGVSKNRVLQVVHRAICCLYRDSISTNRCRHDNTFVEEDRERIERAVESITKKRGGLYETLGYQTVEALEMEGRVKQWVNGSQSTK